MESKLESSALSINDRITALERAIETISKGFSSSESELAKLHALFAEFGVSTKSSTQTLQEKLHNELALLSSKIDRQEKAIMNNKAAVSSSTNSGDKGDGPSFFTVIFLLSVASQILIDLIIVILFNGRSFWSCFWLELRVQGYGIIQSWRQWCKTFFS